MTAKDDRFLCLLNQRDSLIQQIARRTGHRLITNQFYILRIHKLTRLNLRVLADVNQHGTRSPTARNVKCFANRFRNLICTRHEIIVFGDWQRDASYIRLLKRVAADQMRRDLTRNEHGWNRIHHRRTNACD